MAKKIAVQKICFVIPRAYYLFNPNAADIIDKVGGAQKQAYLLSTELAQNKEFDVHFLVADFGQLPIEIYQNVTVWKSFNFNSFILKKTFELLKTLKKIDADIYIFRAGDPGVSLATSYIKKIIKKKVYYMLASNAETNFNCLRKMSGLLTALLMPATYKLADKIFVQTHDQYNLFMQNRKRKPDGVVSNIIPINNQAYKEENFILWVGRLDKIKHAELYINLAKQYPEEKFIMIAPVVRDFVHYGNKIKTLLKSIKNIHYLEFVAPNEIKKYYQKAKIYIITSELEGFSNTMAEAMANKCPILSYKVNPDNIFTQFNAGYFSKGNLDTFYNQFKSLLKNKKQRTDLANNAYQYLRKFHNKEKIINEFVKLLK